MLVDGEGRTCKEKKVCFFLRAFLHVLVCVCVPLFLIISNTDFEKHWSLVSAQCCLNTAEK